jgi:DNA mismatch endonuclease (patch repair protein)
MPEKRAPEVTSRIMSAVKNKDSEAELKLRRALFARGRRYRLHVRELVGRPDLVFTSARLAVFVDGDFWHGNAWRLRGMASFEEQFQFRSRPDWWEAKIRRNMARDGEVEAALAASGWRVLRLWESDVLRDVDACATRVDAALNVEAAPSTRAVAEAPEQYATAPVEQPRAGAAPESG